MAIDVEKIKAAAARTELAEAVDAATAASPFTRLGIDAASTLRGFTKLGVDADHLTGLGERLLKESGASSAITAKMAEMGRVMDDLRPSEVYRPESFTMPPPPARADQINDLIDVVGTLVELQKETQAAHEAEREADAATASRRFRLEMAAIVILGIATLIATLIAAG